MLELSPLNGVSEFLHPFGSTSLTQGYNSPTDTEPVHGSGIGSISYVHKSHTVEVWSNPASSVWPS